MVSVAVEQLTVRYDDAADDAPSALDGATLHVASGELLVLAGPSGSGKTTLLRAVAGLEHPAAGTVRIDGQVVNGVPPRDRDVALVSQLETVFPHLTVEDNLAFALRLRRMPEDETRKRVDAEARALGLWSRLRRRPRQLSTGERQKVALGRATARRPRIFLFDEPLDGLDLTERERMRRELARLQRGLGVTTVYVTHDQVEAMTMGHRVAILDYGVMQQCDTPGELYRHPANLFVAGFIGSPAMNLIPSEHDGASVVFGSNRIPVDGAVKAKLEDIARDDITIGIRPQALSVGSTGIPAEVVVVEELGSETFIFVEMEHLGETIRVRVRVSADYAVKRGDKTSLEVVGPVHVFGPDGLRLRTAEEGNGA